MELGTTPVIVFIYNNIPSEVNQPSSVNYTINYFLCFTHLTGAQFADGVVSPISFQ